MKICTITDQNEVLINTLRDADYIDAVTLSIPTNSIIVDAELPTLSKNQTLKVSGERNDDGYYTVSKNVEVVADFRGEKAYSTENAQEVEITELGDLPSNVTSIARPSEYHTFSNGKWTVTKADAARKQADEAKIHNQQVFAQIEQLEQKQQRPVREAALAKVEADRTSALARIKQLDEQIQQLRATLKPNK